MSSDVLFQQAMQRALVHFLSANARVRRWSDRLKTGPLRTAFDAVGRSVTVPDAMPAGVYAQALAVLAGDWSRAAARENGEWVPTGRPYADWLRDGGAHERFAPVRALQEYATEHRDLLARAVVHGSVGTLDDVPGFSDMDVAFVVREEALGDPDALLELRRLAQHAYGTTLRFDPFMHHEPLFIGEPLLRGYPQSLFPTVLFATALDLIAPRPLHVTSLGAADHGTDDLFGVFRSFFSELPVPLRLGSWYDGEWVLGNAMILPALYLQARDGVYRYKRETFTLARPHFTEAEWAPIEVASRVRASAPPRPAPPRLLVTGASAWRRPELVRTWAIRGRASRRHATVAGAGVPADFGPRTVALIDAMRERLG